MCFCDDNNYCESINVENFLLKMKITPLEKYNTYIKNHPECKIYNQDYILSIMLKENVISEAELKEIKYGNVFGSNIVPFGEDDGYSGFLGVNLSSHETTQNESEIYVEKLNNPHPLAPEIEITADGMVDENNREIYSHDRENELTKTEYYNKPYKSIDQITGKEENYLVKDLMSTTPYTERGHYYSKSKAFNNILLTQLTPENAAKVLKQYKKETGSDLMDFVKDKTVTAHVESCIKNSKDTEFKSQYISDCLVDDIYGVGTGDLENHIKMITFDSVGEVLEAYKNKTQRKAKPYNDFMLNLGVRMKKRHEICKKLNIDENLVEGIVGKRSLSETKKMEIIDYLINCVTEKASLANVYIGDISHDIDKNKTAPEKLNVDFLRALKRGSVQQTSCEAPNGRIDIPFKQGRTGDCWVLAGLISLDGKPELKKQLENQIQVDLVTKDVTVTLAGVGKKYLIKSDIIEKSNHLADSDGDVRAIEIAIDQYRKECAYDEKNSLRLDVSAGAVDQFYKILFKDCDIEYRSLQNDDNFNHSDTAYVMGTQEYSFSAVDEDGKKVFVSGHHGIAISGSDNEFIFVRDPHNSAKVLKIKREEFIEHPVKVGILKFKD